MVRLLLYALPLFFWACGAGTENNVPSGNQIVSNSSASDSADEQKAGSADNFSILSGSHIGPIKAFGPSNSKVTIKALHDFFGKENITDTVFIISGGDEVPGRLLYEGTPNQAMLMMPDDHPDNDAILLVADTPGGEWHLGGTSVRIGSTLQEVEEANGACFNLFAGTTPEAGTVSDWKDGKLKGQTIFFSPTDGSRFTISAEDESSPYINCADYRLQKIDLRVSKIVAVLEPYQFGFKIVPLEN